MSSGRWIDSRHGGIGASYFVGHSLFSLLNYYWSLDSSLVGPKNMESAVTR